MNRKVLLISNPGEIGEENYCSGVNVDVKNYNDFLISPLGGYWHKNEILNMPRPDVEQVVKEANNSKKNDYLLIIFCGHGFFYQGDTYLTLKKGQNLKSSLLRTGAPKQTIILDSCREIVKSLLLEEFAKMLAEAQTRLSADSCRFHYDKEIEKCANALVEMFACKVGETAGDDPEKGGFYSNSLVSACKKWARYGDIDLSNQYSVLSVAKAHDEAYQLAVERSGDRQHPQISKPRSEKYFPFAIMA